MGKSRKRQYTLEFKEQAVELAKRIGIGRAAEELGVGAVNIQRWKAKEGKTSEKLAEGETIEQENRRLRKENDELKKVNQILKRAAAFFSQDHLK